MALEKRWEQVSQNFVANGNTNGVVAVNDANGFFAKQKVTIKSNTQQPAQFEVKRVTDVNNIIVGPVGGSIDTRSDLSLYLVADSANIFAAEQPKPNIQPDEIFNAVYQRDPTVALRNLLVDTFGVPITVVTDINGNKRLAVDATVSISGVTVDLDAFTKVPPDNAISVGTEDGTKTGVKHAIKIGSDLKLEVKDTAADASLASIDAKLNSLGQKLMAGSVPVTMASDQSPIPVTGSFTATINLDAFTKLPADNAISVGTEDGTQTGVKHALKIGSDLKAEVKDTAVAASLASLDSKINTLGQKLMAASTPVVIASDQSAVPISAASLPLPAGAATEATLALIKAKTDNLDVALSTRATEATLGLIKAKTDNLDVLLSTRASEATLALIKTSTDNLDVALSTRSSEATLVAVKGDTANLDVPLSTRATEATLAAINAKLNSLGQKLMAGSVPVVIASDQSPVPVTGSFSATLNIDAFTKVPADNLVIVGTEDGTQTGVKHAAVVDSALDLKVGISNGANKAGVNTNDELLVHDADVLTSVNAMLALINGIIASGALSAFSVGTEDGTVTGVKHVFVNNLRQMILASHDREADFTYADFGTKNQRITQIDYSSPTFTPFTLQRVFNYVLIGTKYKRTNEIWSVV